MSFVESFGNLLGLRQSGESETVDCNSGRRTSARYDAPTSPAAASISSPVETSSLRESFRANRQTTARSGEDSPSKKSEDAFRKMMSALTYLLIHPQNGVNEFESAVANMLVEKDTAKVVPYLNILKHHGWVDTKFEELTNIPRLHREMGIIYLTMYDPSNSALIENFWNKRLRKFDSFHLEKKAAIASFCPNILLEYLETAVDSLISKEKIICGVGVRSYSFDGAVMFVDISGFTSFCIQYCSNGTAGLDELHKICNGFLGRVVQFVYAFGGDVISFAGDALICVFKESPSYVLKETDDFARDYLMKALQCSMVLANLSTDKLYVHIGLTCGQLFLGSVGGYRGQWTYLLNGKCITELGSCLNDANSKQVVMTPHFYDEVLAAFKSMDASFAPDDFQIQKRSSGNLMAVHLNLSSTTMPLYDSRFREMNLEETVVDTVSNFVPLPVVTAIDHLNTIDELREVTTMFLKLDSFSPSDHCDPINLQAFYYGAQEALLENGGFCRQFLIDDKGCILIAMWGVPSFSYTDNEVRAIDAVVAIQSLLRKIGHSCSVGIASGNVYCGVIGSVSRRDFVGIGDKVNLAARLMGKANGRVLIDVNTYNRLPLLCRSHCQDEPEVRMKGLEAFVKAYSVNYKVMPPLQSTILGAKSTGKEKQKYVRYDIAQKIDEQIDMMELAYSRAPSRMGSTKFVAFTASESVEHLNANVLHQSFEIKLSTISQENASTRSLDVGEAAAGLRFTLSTSGKNEKTEDNTPIIAPQRSGSIGFTGNDQFINERQPSWAQSFVSRLYNHREHEENNEMGAVFTIIAGPAGSGKSAVMKYFKRRSISRRMTYHSLRCKLGDENVAFGVVSRLMVKFIDAKVSNYQEQIVALKTLLRSAVPLLNESELMLKVGLAYRFLFDTKTKKSKDIGKDGLHKDGFMVTLLSVLLSKRCYAIVIQDAQFCDELSWQLLRSTLEFPVHVCIMMTIRQEIESKKGKSYTPLNIVPFGGHFNPSPAYYAITDHRNTALLFMDKMSEEEVGDLLREILNCQSISSTLVSSVYDACNGNQYWCKTVAKFILEQGYQRVENAVTADKTVASSLPALIVAMYERLAITQQVIIKHASVIGAEFSAEQLIAVLPSLFEGDQARLKSLCQPLMDNGFLTILDDDDMSGHLYYQIPNDFIRSVLYDLVPRSDAGKIHLQIATHIESVFGNNIVDHFPSLIYHYSMSPDGLKSALKYTLMCAEQVILWGAYTDGLIQLNHAFDRYESLLNNDQLVLILDLIDVAVSDIKKCVGDYTSSKGKNKNGRKDDVAGYLELKAKVDNFLPVMRMSQRVTLKPVTSFSRMSFSPATSARVAPTEIHDKVHTSHTSVHAISNTSCIIS